MARGASRLAEVAYLAMRVIVGLAFAQHGAQKLFGLLGGQAVPWMSQFGLAGAIELVAGIMVALGLFGRWAAFVASGEMAFAYFMAHAPQGFWPVQNKGELAMIYCFVFLYIAARGSGPWSLTRD